MPYSHTLGFSIPRKFSLRNGHTYRSTKVFSLESFPLYGNPPIPNNVWCHAMPCITFFPLFRGSLSPWESGWHESNECHNTDSQWACQTWCGAEHGLQYRRTSTGIIYTVLNDDLIEAYIYILYLCVYVYIVAGCVIEGNFFVASIEPPQIPLWPHT